MRRGSRAPHLAALFAGVFSLSAAGEVQSPPDFAPNGSVGWVAMSGVFINPASGPGPVMADPAHPRVSNDDLRATGAQPTFPMADANAPILQPWAKDVLRQRNELVLSGKPAFPPQASCWPVGVPHF